MIEEPLTLVFVVGCQRSGTTLTGQILGAHPRAVLLDEPDGIYPWFDALDPEEPLARPALSAVLERAAEKYAHPEQRFQRLTDRRMWFAPGVTHIILKAPNLTYYGPKIERLRARKKIVSLMRDPCDVVASMQKLSQIPMVENQVKLMRRQSSLPDWVAPELARLQDQDLPINHKRAVVWAIKTRFCQELARIAQGGLRLIYEELVTAPEEVLPLLCTHLQLPDHDDLRRHENVFVGTGPGRTSRTRRIDTASLGKSNGGLSEDERSAILSLAGPLAARYRRSAPVDAALAKPPLVLLGRGGSGARLVSHVLKDAGVFLGNTLNHSGDSLEWAKIVHRGLSDKFARTQDLDAIAVPELKPKLLETARRVLERSDFEAPETVLWGWNLPETMLLVPELLDAFPQAKIVHLVRHPVTLSLRRTPKASRPSDEVGRYVLSAARSRITVPPQHGLDEDTLNNALSWRLQVGGVTEMCRRVLSPCQHMEIRYEDLLDDWSAVRRRLSDFLGVPSAEIPRPELDASRKAAFTLPDDRVGAVWQITRDVAELHGYALAQDGSPRHRPTASRAAQ